MIPNKGWRSREANARARQRGALVNPEIRAARDALLREREALIAAQAAAETVREPGIVTAAGMLENQAPAPVIDDVTPEDDEAPESAQDEPEAAADEPEAVEAPDAPEAAPEAPEAPEAAPEAAPVAPKPKPKPKPTAKKA